MIEAYQARFATLRAWLSEQGAATGLVTASVSMKYLTGWSNPSKRFSGLLVPATGEPVLIAPALEKGEASGAAVRDLRLWADGEDPFALLSALISAVGSGTLAVEKEALTLASFEAVARGLGKGPGSLLAGAVDLSPVIMGMRARKGADELEHLQRAADMLNPALEAALRAIRPGITERQLAAVLEQAMLEAGAQGFAFETHVLFGEKSALPHGSTGDRRLAPGEVVLLDFGALYQGYRSDITRTLCLGEWSPEMARVYDTVLAAHDAAIAAIRPGVSVGDVDAAARKVIEDAGYGPYFIHRTGHGLGLEIHEEPYLVGGSAAPLQVGHVCTVEPGIYLSGVGGVRIEDDVVVTEGGCRLLTSYPTDRRSV